MYKPKAVLENEIHTILMNFEIQIDSLLPARRPDLLIINYNPLKKKKKKNQQKKQQKLKKKLREPAV